VDITGRLGGCQRWCRRFTRRRDREVAESALRLADHAVLMPGPGRSEVAGPHPAFRARGSSSALVSWQGCREQGYIRWCDAMPCTSRASRTPTISTAPRCAGWSSSCWSVPVLPIAPCWDQGGAECRAERDRPADQVRHEG
jgi:hypothetical protein